MRSVLVAAAVLIGELVPKFDLVMGVIGGTLTGPLVFVLPPLFYAKICRLEVAFDAEVARIRRDRTTLDDDDGSASAASARTSDGGGVNGNDDDDDDAFAESRMATMRYGTFRRTAAATSGRRAAGGRIGQLVRRIWQTLCGDIALAVAVIVFGLTATVASTYFSALHVQSLREFWSPCIHNITYSFASL